MRLQFLKSLTSASELGFFNINAPLRPYGHVGVASSNTSGRSGLIHRRLQAEA